MRKLIRLIIITFIAFLLIGWFSDDEADASYTDLILDEMVYSEKYKDAKSTTVLIYMIGSDLESESGEATEDISEMLKADISGNTNVVIQTMGTKKWQKYGISSKRSQRYKVVGDKLELVDDSLSQLDSTKANTLEDFITWGTTKYKADRYELILWNHGGGPVYGFGLDQFQEESESLTIDEIQTALKNAKVHFDFIGMDSCIMSSLEVLCILQPYCDYAILSEDFESGYGWQYTRWLKQLDSTPNIETVTLGKILVDDMIKANNDNLEDSATLAVIDESKVGKLYSVWKQFAYNNEKELLKKNYSQKKTEKGRGFILDWLTDNSSVTMEEYYVTDMMALALSIDSSDSEALQSALNEAISYYKYTSSDTLTGISVSLPYGDKDFYNELRTVYLNSGFDEEYVNYLEKFVKAKGANNYYDYSSMDDLFDGWSSFIDSFNWDSYDLDSYDDESWYDDWFTNEDNDDDTGFFESIFNFLFS